MILTLLLLAEPTVRERDDGKLAAEIARAAVSAAHPTARKIELQSFATSCPRPGRTDLKVEASYRGLSGRTYYATVILKIDDEPREALGLDYRDSNRLTRPSLKNLNELVRKLNRPN